MLDVSVLEHGGWDQRIASEKAATRRDKESASKVAHSTVSVKNRTNHMEMKGLTLSSERAAVTAAGFVLPRFQLMLTAGMRNGAASVVLMLLPDERF